MSIIQNNNDDYEDNLLTSCGNFQLPQGSWNLSSDGGSIRFLSLGNIIAFDESIIFFWNPIKKLYQYLFSPSTQIIVDFKCENKLAYECVLIENSFKYEGYISFLSRVTNNILNQLKNNKNKSLKVQPSNKIRFFLNQKKNDKKKNKSFKVQPNNDDLKDNNCCQKVNCNKNDKKKNKKKKNKKKKNKKKNNKKKVTFSI